MPFRFLAAVIASGLALSVVSNARADLLVKQGTLVGSNFSVDNGVVLGFNFGPFTVDGTINSASLTFNGSVTPTITIPANGTFNTVTIQSVAGFYAPNGPNGLAPFAGQLSATTLEATVSVPIGATTVSSPSQALALTGQFSGGSGLQAALQSGFTTNVDVATLVKGSTGSGFFLGGTDYTSPNLQAGGFAYLNVNYTPTVHASVPEPMTLSLLGGGLLGLVALRRKAVARL